MSLNCEAMHVDSHTYHHSITSCTPRKALSYILKGAAAIRMGAKRRGFLSFIYILTPHHFKKNKMRIKHPVLFFLLLPHLTHTPASFFFFSSSSPVFPHLTPVGVLSERSASRISLGSARISSAQTRLEY
jgi:hypothetical protein